MNKTTCAGLTALAALGLVAAGTTAHAATTIISGFDFENLPSNTGTAQAPATIAADQGVDAKTSNLTAGGTTSFSSIEPDNATPSYAYIAGGDLTPGTSTVSNYALRLGIGKNGVSTTNPQYQSANNGSALFFNASTVGFNAITVSYDTSASSSGAFQTQTLLYSTNGTSFTTFSAVTPPATNAPTADSAGYTPESFNLSGISALANDPNAKFELLFTNAVGYTSNKAPNDRIDDLSVTGNAASPAPEPSQVGMLALMGLGLGGLMLRARRRAVAA